MLTKSSFYIFLFLLLSVNSRSQWLQTKGTAIINDKGDTVLLRGMGLGGWMLQEGYMFRLSFLGQQYRIKEKIQELVGKTKTKQFYDDWLLNHTTKQDVDSLAAWGFNSIRLPMHYDLYTLSAEDEPVKGQHTWLEKGFAMTDSLLKWCRDNKIYLILDLHAAPGGQGNDLPISDRNPSRPSLWESGANQEKTVALWRKLASRYANEPWIVGFDIINEPNWGFGDPVKDFRGIAENKNVPLKELMIAITKAIREVDKKHIVIIEGNGFGNNYRGVLPPWDSNMVLSFHKYGNFNTIASIKGFLDLRDKYTIPLWLGESGENSNTWFTEAIRLMEDNRIGWAWWQLKKMGVNNPLEIKRPVGYDQLLDYWSGKGTRPSEAAAWNTLQQLLENLKIGHTVFHADVVDAMFRQVRSAETLPFREHKLAGKLVIKAVDFDLGSQRIAYCDKDSARYQYTPGVNTDGNKGHAYRNDGVDILNDDQGYCIFSTEDGEWLQFTINVETEGSYRVSFLTAAEKEGAAVSLHEAGKNITGDLVIPVTGGMQRWKPVTADNVHLKKGMNKFRVMIVKGGFNLADIQFEKQ